MRKRATTLHKTLELLRGGLIVSVQPREPLNQPSTVAALAEAAVLGGAVGIRVNGPDDVAAVRKQLDVPILGIYKQRDPNYQVYITPTAEAAKAVTKAGADIVALDGADAERPTGITLKDLIASVHEQGALVMADISTLEEGLFAVDAGADIVSSTLSGYTSYSRQQKEPDLELISELAANVDVPIIAEGRYATPEQVAAAFERGAFSVVVGRAITEPQLLTQQFAAVAPRNNE